jgi:membrane fusion protein, multidrug efflux system
MKSTSRERGVFYLVGLVSGGLAIAAAIGFRMARAEHIRGLNGQAGQPPGIVARVVRARWGPGHRRLEVPGEVRAFASVTLYAKVSGYLGEMRVDRGDRVTAGQVLAVIRSPELERQQQAAVADASHKAASAASAAALAKPGAISSRQLEAEKTSARMAEAVLEGIKAQRGFTILRAPFDGTVTARYADPGALVQSAASAQSGALPLVTISQTDRLRVFAYLDQRNNRLVRLGDRAEVLVPESGESFSGRVERVSGELEAHSRTMLVEIQFEEEAAILPGSFVRVRLDVKATPLVEVPAGALVLRDQKTFVAVVSRDSRVQLRPVTVGHLDGTVVGLTAGVAAGEAVALDLGRAVVAGDLIRPVGSDLGAGGEAIR